MTQEKTEALIAEYNATYAGGMSSGSEAFLRRYLEWQSTRATPSPDTLRDEFIRLLDAADRYNGSHIANRQPEGRLQGNLILAIQRAYRVLGIGRTNTGGSHD